MPKVSFNKINEEKAEVISIVYPENMYHLVDGIVVQEIPKEPELPKLKYSLMYVNPKTGAIWYELFDREPTPEELAEQERKDLIQRVELAEEALNFLLMGDM